ncbi:TadE-like protein [Roseovarius halotolerans]|uniref:TadE-like protein n=1 Tax=Roseovarius halotolerans TaxID=505353 RepID=A0A1X6Y8Z0_9RHOB|nr:TadE family protein [Roseovarius halotolerans]RKT35103.1 TadE-like protein [Roseovarius halotolerans]SLN13775.1 TadE-like protein [Roseovarius halotolerans]
MTRFISRRLSRLRRDDSGNASVEFVIIFPVFVMFLLFSIELSVITLRHAMLERGLDLTVRQIRLGYATPPNHPTIKNMVCEFSHLGGNCSENLRLEMKPVDIRAYSGLDATPDCSDEAQPTKPVRQFVPGQRNQLMLLRACLKYDPMMPQDILGKALKKDSSGQAAVVSMSAFVQEP